MGLDEMSDACSYGGRDSTGYNTYLDDLDRSEARRLLSISDTNTVKSDTALEDHILHSNNRRHLSLHPHDFIRQHSCPGVRLESDETFLWSNRYIPVSCPRRHILESDKTFLWNNAYTNYLQHYRRQYFLDMFIPPRDETFLWNNIHPLASGVIALGYTSSTWIT